MAAMPWCVSCNKFLTPSTVRPDATCPKCGKVVERGLIPGMTRPADEAPPAVPWHLKLVGAATRDLPRATASCSSSTGCCTASAAPTRAGTSAAGHFLQVVGALPSEAERDELGVRVPGPACAGGSRRATNQSS